MYAPENASDVMKFRYFDLTTRKDTILPTFEKDIPIDHGYRSIKFSGTSSHILNIFYKPPGCLWVLDKNDGYYPDLPQQLKDMLVLSNFDQINSDEDVMDTLPKVFGPPVEKDWCYYFESADLARQNQDWDDIAELGDTSLKNGLQPAYLVEYFPFIEGYAYNGQYERALELSALLLEDANLTPKLCEIWANVIDASIYKIEELNTILETINDYPCNY